MCWLAIKVDIYFFIHSIKCKNINCEVKEKNFFYIYKKNVYINEINLTIYTFKKNLRLRILLKIMVKGLIKMLP